ADLPLSATYRPALRLLRWPRCQTFDQIGDNSVIDFFISSGAIACRSGIFGKSSFAPYLCRWRGWAEAKNRRGPSRALAVGSSEREMKIDFVEVATNVRTHG